MEQKTIGCYIQDDPFSRMICFNIITAIDEMMENYCE